MSLILDDNTEMGLSSEYAFYLNWRQRGPIAFSYDTRRLPPPSPPQAVSDRRNVQQTVVQMAPARIRGARP
jgi:hypothetical protein